MTLRAYKVRFQKRTLRITECMMPDGKFEQYQIAAANRNCRHSPDRDEK